MLVSAEGRQGSVDGRHEVFFSKSNDTHTALVEDIAALCRVQSAQAHKRCTALLTAEDEILAMLRAGLVPEVPEATERDAVLDATSLRNLLAGFGLKISQEAAGKVVAACAPKPGASTEESVLKGARGAALVLREQCDVVQWKQRGGQVFWCRRECRRRR